MSEPFAIGGQGTPTDEDTAEQIEDEFEEGEGAEASGDDEEGESTEGSPESTETFTVGETVKGNWHI